MGRSGGRGGSGGEEGGLGGAGGGAAEEVALGPLAAEVAEGGDLVGGLDALGHGGEAEAVGQVDDAPHDGGVAGPAVHPGHERAVHLQQVDREAAQVGQGRVAGAEVVDHDLHPQVPQGGDLADGHVLVVEQDVLGDLDLDAGGVDARVVDDDGDVLHHGVVAELGGGEVHVDPEAVAARVPAARPPSVGRPRRTGGGRGAR